MIDIASHVSFRIGHGKQRSKRSAALDLQGDRAVLRFLHVAHHGRRAQKSSERCRRRGKHLVHLPRALDSINYVTKPQDVQKTFCRIYESLRPGGLFVFDINTPYKLESLDGQVFLDETEDSYCVWRAVYDRRHSLCRYGMDLFQRLEDDTWERSFEEHVERAYTPQELSGWLMDAGFAQVGQFGNLRLAPPQPDEMRIFFAAKKGT